MNYKKLLLSLFVFGSLLHVSGYSNQSPVQKTEHNAPVKAQDNRSVQAQGHNAPVKAQDNHSVQAQGHDSVQAQDNRSQVQEK